MRRYLLLFLALSGVADAADPWTAATSQSMSCGTVTSLSSFDLKELELAVDRCAPPRAASVPVTVHLSTPSEKTLAVTLEGVGPRVADCVQAEIEWRWAGAHPNPPCDATASLVLLPTPALPGALEVAARVAPSGCPGLPTGTTDALADAMEGRVATCLARFAPTLPLTGYWDASGRSASISATYARFSPPPTFYDCVEGPMKLPLPHDAGTTCSVQVGFRYAPPGTNPPPMWTKPTSTSTGSTNTTSTASDTTVRNLSGTVSASTGKTSMNVTMNAVEASGLRIQKLSCAVEQGGLGLGATLIASLAAQKAALDACAPTGGAYDLAWKLEQGKAAGLKVTTGSPSSANACVAAAAGKLTVSSSAWLASCTARVLVGEAAGADKAAAGLPGL